MEKRGTIRAMADIAEHLRNQITPLVSPFETSGWQIRTRRPNGSDNRVVVTADSPDGKRFQDFFSEDENLPEAVRGFLAGLPK